MSSRNRGLSGTLALTVVVFLISAFAYADSPKDSQDATTDTPAKQTTTGIVAPPPAETPSDARALSADEMATYGAQEDSTLQSPQVQEMNVGADVNWTIVLSVLVALLIFAVVVAIL